jgi:hypothetical protein
VDPIDLAYRTYAYDKDESSGMHDDS